MPFPTVENGPWTFDVNNDCTGANFAETMKNVLLQMKTSLATFSAWSVVASSNSTSVKNIGDVSPDLWSTIADIVRNTDGNIHSWVVLENSVNGEHICIDYNTSYDYRLSVLYDPDGTTNTDGTTSDRPTGTWLSAQYDTKNFLDQYIDGAVVHAMISNDSKCTRLIIHGRDGSLNGDTVLFFEEAVNTPSQWTNTHKRVISRNQADYIDSATNTLKSPTLATFDDFAAFAAFTSTAISQHGTCECFENVIGSGVPLIKYNTNFEWGGGYPVCQIGLYRYTSENIAGPYGRLQDIYWAHYYHDTYDTYNAASSRAWVKIGCFMLPWNGTQPLEVP